MRKKQARTMLEERLIPFWSALRDEDHGGFYGYMDFDLSLDRQAEKGCILNSRILWFFSRCAAQLGQADCLENARRAYTFLTGHCLDKKYGGVYWSLNYGGSPQDTSKHTYVQSFFSRPLGIGSTTHGRAAPQRPAGT